MKTHGESRRLPFKVGPMEAEGCPVTPSNGIEIQWYMSCTIPGHKSWNTLTIPVQYWREHMHTAASAWQSIPRSRDILITYMSCKRCLVLRCLQLGSSFLICKKCAGLSPSEALDSLLFNGTMSNWSRMLLICCFSQFWGHLNFLTSFKKGPSIA